MKRISVTLADLADAQNIQTIIENKQFEVRQRDLAKMVSRLAEIQIKLIKQAINEYYEEPTDDKDKQSKINPDEIE